MLKKIFKRKISSVCVSIRRGKICLFNNFVKLILPEGALRDDIHTYVSLDLLLASAPRGRSR